ncbi:MAG: hypothetical protein ACYCY9_10605 [Thiobacillus sp.]
MLRTLLIATALLAASGTALAHGDDGRGRVISVEPHFVISFGTRHPDGFRVLYESGGARYWTHTQSRPGRVIVLPPPYRVMHEQHYRNNGRGWDSRRGWDDDHGRRGWDGRREHYREHRSHHRDDRRHGRD